MTLHFHEKQDYRDFLQILDANKNGTIEEEEFLKIIEERAGLPDDIDAQEEAYRSAFRVFDRDESGKISAEELRYFIPFKTYNKNIPDACLSLINLLYLPPKKIYT